MTLLDTVALVKPLHLATAVLSIGGFVLRGLWMLRGSPLLRHRLTRILPHVNDTLLFGAGLWLLFTTAQYPTQQPWLAAKLTALVVYILLGMVALKRGRTPAIRATAFVAALAVFGYMVAVALTRSPLPFFNGT
jgi:uncharacterized membrane protein SirB2